ncbi:hypothetical protein QQF64_006647 [Cirrhinus molitorella]|uniref:Uncharacterized protein n=1 Tax=Cirrhinus molitorella TaxID=172907 RepID=A0ABR3M8G0_9TELE
MSRSLFFDGMQQRYKYRRANVVVLSFWPCCGGRVLVHIKMRTLGGCKEVAECGLNLLQMKTLATVAPMIK